MDQTSTTENIGSTPLDVFDTTDEGFEPHTLEETVQAAHAVLESLRRFQMALGGCMTPLALDVELKQARKAAERAAVWVEELGKAREIVEGDLPLGDSIGGETDDFCYDLPWEDLVLSPADLIELNTRANGLPLRRLTNYRREIELSPRVPSVIIAHRRRTEKEAEKATRSAAKKEAQAASRQALEDAVTGDVHSAEATERLKAERRLAEN